MYLTALAFRPPPIRSATMAHVELVGFKSAAQMARSSMLRSACSLQLKGMMGERSDLFCIGGW